MSRPWQRNPIELADSTSIMDRFNIHDFIKNWWAKNVVRANGMSIEIQKITNEYLEIGIDGNFLQLTIPHSFSTNSSADGIISNADCGFIVTLAKGKNDSNNMGSVQEILTTLNEKLDRISCHGNYSFGSVLDSVMDTLEKYKNCSDCEGSASEIYDDEDSGTSDCEGHSTATTDPIQLLRKKGYFYQLVEKANGRCDQARLMAAMSARVEMPCKVNEKDNILRWSKAYLPSHQDPHGVRFEIELTGILSDEYRHRHGHVFEALGFSFSTPLLIEVKFDFCKINFESTSCTGLSLGDALQEVSAWHEGVESKVAHNERNFASAEALPDELYEPIHKVIDGSRVDRPVDLYGLRFLLPRMTKDFFSDPDHNDNNNVLLASEGNIFVRFLLFIGSRLNSLLKRCIVCNKELPFTVSKLCSCADKLCLFGFEELGWGTQVLQELKQKTVELIDLEISFALAATDFRRDVFEPFPPFLLWDREIRYRSGLFDNIHIPVDRGNKNMVLLGSIIHSFPPVSEMRLCVDEVELKEKLANSWLSSPAGKSIHKQWVEKEGRQLPYNVLRFILCTNRMSLVCISENDEKLIKDDKKHPHWKCYQFAVVHDSPEREAYFESSRTSKLRECHPWYSNILKKKSSGSKQQCSKFSFHGSLPHNWYSIMRNGVRCLSRTHLMSNGSQGGPGIYLAKYFNKSANFSFELPQEKFVSGWKNGLYKDGFYVVSICELIACPVTKYRRRIFRSTQGVRMVPKEYERCVAVRYLLVITCTRPHKDLKEMSSCRCYLGAGISDGKTWYDRHNKKINLHQHYQRLRQKYLSTISEIEP